ncbi:MAG: FKBP-type peptidyl-prolyl cis-trans isomerase [Gemmatimonadota bacterium]|jgi:FKBP-type peptidyl-prolyl cis-trans isomerase
MNRNIGIMLLLAPLFLGACQSQGGSGPATLDTEDQKGSYVVGLQVGSQLAPSQGFFDMDAFLAGLRDGMAESEPALPQEELQPAFTAFNQKIMTETTRLRAEAAEENALAGAEFLQENATKEGVTVTESGLQYEVLSEGDGPTPGPDDQVRIHYKGTLIDGTQFDSSYDRGEPTDFGVSGVIRGFSEGLQLMPVGSHYRFYIPSEIGYGSAGQGQIEPNATLIFEVELLEILEEG